MTLDDSIAREFHEWTGTPLGRSLVDQEREQLQPMLSRIYGPVAVQYGPLDFSEYLQSSNAIRKLHSLNQPPQTQNEPQPACLLYSLPEFMPFGAKSVNMLILPHVLEFSADPHRILRESARVLVPEGHLVLICFNPNSLWGVRRGLGGIVNKRLPVPWRGRFFRLSRVKDWLSVLGFEVVQGRSACFTPPVKSSSMRERFAFLDSAGARWWPMFAAVFILVVRKREVGMTPIPALFKRKKRLAPALPEPAARAFTMQLPGKAASGPEELSAVRPPNALRTGLR